MAGNYVTKHCDPTNLKNMLAGHFRIGTTREYANIEGGGLFDDKKEGTASNRLLGNQKIDFMTLPGGIVISDCVFEESEVAVAHEFEVDAHVFCASDGDYSKSRHEALISGNDQYKSNPSYTEFLVLDKLKLSYAINAAIDESTGLRHDMISETIQYLDRPLSHSDQNAFKSPRAYSIATKQAVFNKPTRFSIEEEYRYLAMRKTAPRSPLKPILTKDLSVKIQALFKDAVVRSGSAEKPAAPPENLIEAAAEK